MKNRIHFPNQTYRPVDMGRVVADNSGGDFSLPECEQCGGTGQINGQQCGWCVRSRIAGATAADRPPVQFVGVHENVMQGSKCVARACSKTMAKRIANALNKHVPNREGV